MPLTLENRLFVRRLWLFAFALWIAVTAISGIALWHLRLSATEFQSREIDLFSRGVADEMDRALRGVEDGLFAIRDELKEGRSPLTGTEAERVLHLQTKFMPVVKALWLIDGDGRLLAASNNTNAPDLLSFSTALSQLDENQTIISRPFEGMAGRESLVALAVRLGAENDFLHGWILAAMPAKALLGGFSVASPGGGARMAVFRDDGVRLVGSLLDVPKLDEAALAQHLALQPTIEFREFPDGSKRLVSLSKLPHYGLKMVVTRDMGIALSSWRETAQGVMAGISLLLVILMVSVQQVARVDRRHFEAQQALQRQLSRASKLESLGKLAGGVAHDFNNVLAVILGYGEMAQDAAAPRSNQARHLANVVQGALRGKALAERILAFSRGGAHTLSVFELGPIVDQALTLLAGALGENVILERHMDAASARVRGDPTQAFEATMNLCTNAMQAMAETGGALSVRLNRLRVSVPRVLSHSQLTIGDYVVLTVADQGSGISAEAMDHLFEPFFTTRPQSGTGLGLAVVHGVVAEFGGAIDVQSAPGHGSQFALYFPECTDAISPTEPLPETVPAGGGQRLMIIDDEPDLVRLAEETLRELGYEPTGYTDPAVALEALLEGPKRFAAVITDEVMPGLSGTKLTTALRAHLPDLPVLLISGYGGALLASRASAAGVTRVMSKPLERAKLAQVLNDLLH